MSFGVESFEVNNKKNAKYFIRANLAIAALTMFECDNVSKIPISV